MVRLLAGAAAVDRDLQLLPADRIAEPERLDAGQQRGQRRGDARRRDRVDGVLGDDRPCARCC